MVWEQRTDWWKTLNFLFNDVYVRERDSGEFVEASRRCGRFFFKYLNNNWIKNDERMSFADDGDLFWLRQLLNLDLLQS
jgi:hypothetical protein